MTTQPLKLQAINIYKKFGSNEVLKGVSLEARAGDVIQHHRQLWLWQKYIFALRHNSSTP